MTKVKKQVSQKQLLKNFAVKDLRTLAKNYNADARIKNISKMRKSALVDALFKASQENAGLRNAMKSYEKKFARDLERLSGQPR